MNKADQIDVTKLVKQNGVKLSTQIIHISHADILLRAIDNGLLDERLFSPEALESISEKFIEYLDEDFDRIMVEAIKWYLGLGVNAVAIEQ